MSEQTQTPPAASKDGHTQALKETEHVEAGPGGPGRGPFGGGMVGQKANDFKPNAKRLVARMAPERTKAFLVVVVRRGQRRRDDAGPDASSAGPPT